MREETWLTRAMTLCWLAAETGPGPLVWETAGSLEGDASGGQQEEI